MEKGIFIPKDKLKRFMAGASMSHQYGIQVYCTTDREKAQALLPPPLEMTDNPLVYIYIVNIREPTFGPWYMEGGIGLLARYGEVTGVHFLGLMLSGPGALMGMCSGREGSGLPKKLCERIRVERLDNTGRCFIERDGTRLVDVELEMGSYNDPTFRQQQDGVTKDSPLATDGGCINFRYTLDDLAFKDMKMTFYDSPTRFHSWEPATAKVTLASTINDPWAEVPITGVLGAGWMVSDNWVRSQRVLREFTQQQADEAMQYLFAGRYDKSTLCTEHQVYE